MPNDGSDDIVELDPATAAEMNRFDAPPVSGGPDGLAFNGSSLFFLNGSATLWELNPDTGAVLDFDLLTVGSGGYDGLAALGGRVYILDYVWSDLLQFDPVSDTVTSVLDIDGLNPGVTNLVGGLAGITGPDALIVTEGPSTVLEIDPVSGFVSNSFALPVRLTMVWQWSTVRSTSAREAEPHKSTSSPGAAWLNVRCHCLTSFRA